MSSNYSVELQGPAPWGFRLQGGKDFNMPLAISRVTDIGKAAKAGIAVGDLVLTINGVSTDSMNHLEAQNKIKGCTGNLSLNLQRAPSVQKPAVPPKDVSTEIITSPPSDTANSSYISSTPNQTILPFEGVGPQHTQSSTSALSPTPTTLNTSHFHTTLPSSSGVTNDSTNQLPVVPWPSVYNTPIQLYSNENAREAALGQGRGLVEAQLSGIPRKPITQTDIEFYHVPTHADASRKRIMEDTEDWRPRTGTSQSRSFRILAQITGTEAEGAQPKETETAKQTVNEVLQCELRAHVTSPVKTMIKGSGSPVKNTAGLITPTFGSVSSSPPLGPALDRPLPRPHPKDEASLVQRAEHIPAGTRTPVCAHCDTVIRGPFLVAMGSSWHPEEFVCVRCGECLSERGFVEDEGSVYCAQCYELYLAPTCARCSYKILGEVINALKQTWHVYCFLCVSCQQPIRNNTFHLEDGEPYCERDYYGLFGAGCHGCDFPIEAGDKFVEALGFTWHDTCFVCAVCCSSLEGQTFFSKKDKPLCRKHANTPQP